MPIKKKKYRRQHFQSGVVGAGTALQSSGSGMPIIEAVVYARVSDKKQKLNGNGLDSQETRLREYAAKRGYSVVAAFYDDISGQYAERDGLEDMMTFLKSQRRPFIVLMDHSSRLTRNYRDHWPLRDKLIAVSAVLESPEKRYADDPSPEDELHENIDVSVNHYQRRQNAIQTKNRMRARAMNGYWGFHAPVGYKYEKVDPHGKMLVRDEPVASLIKEVLEGYANGRFQTHTEVMRFLAMHPHYPDKKKRNLSVERVKEILVREQYAGYITQPNWDLYLIPAKHEPLISFETHQRILDRVRGRAVVPARKNVAQEFPLRQFVLCGGCGNPVMGCCSTSRNGTRHPYYLCQTKGCEHYGKSTRRDDMHNAFEIILKSLVPLPEVIEGAAAMFRDIWEENRKVAKLQAQAMKSEAKKVDQSIQQYLDRIIETEDKSVIKAYESRVQSLNVEKTALQEKIANCGRPLVDYDTTFRTAQLFLENPFILWDSERLEDKRAVLKMAFSEPLKYDRKLGFRTAEISMPFKMLNDVECMKIKDGAPGRTRTDTSLDTAF